MIYILSNSIKYYRILLNIMTNVKISLNIPEEHKEKLEKLAKEFDTDVSKFLRQLIKKVVE